MSQKAPTCRDLRHGCYTSSGRLQWVDTQGQPGSQKQDHRGQLGLLLTIIYGALCLKTQDENGGAESRHHLKTSSQAPAAVRSTSGGLLPVQTNVRSPLPPSHLVHCFYSSVSIFFSSHPFSLNVNLRIIESFTHANADGHADEGCLQRALWAPRLPR